MKITGTFISSLAVIASTPALAFQSSLISSSPSSVILKAEVQSNTLIERSAFLTASAAASVTGSILFSPEPSHARGRATLDYAYDRYVPRITEGGNFYKSTLYAAISKSDWKALEAATAEPPKKSKEDRALEDGGIAKRAAMAGGFSDSRVLTAMDLFAATFSDSSITQKTKSMKAEVEKLREVVQGMNKTARLALGEEKSGGGLFGIGGKAPSQSELAKQVQELYIKGGNAYNQYVFVANDGLPVQLQKLPYL
mmetsp:Transcript_397/g.783  ORF Transcript_397/g.783 Transcript_397/m.783 type:complete len:254 (-) Transcript_397:95-856(-)|eukprot:CAMPEP_0171335870 /NCGR_PEP_ID=MMETSP0878-20121228/5621_1 /TAXON_ID=67004 /ORGANISM="Thalassiosira weissflogii, Strain CCMP1336" /LENGTH=253 /DNA_ID=CAMNT_0011837201 /DNA_START=36 /DNA_END=797 /DNA_ORIENTATION=-